MQIGAQLYTVREAMQSKEAISLTLRKIAEIGYRIVQLSGNAPVEADWMKAELDRNGLKCVVTHNAPQRLQEDTDALVRDHEILGCKYVGLGSYPFRSPKNPERTYENYLLQYRPVADKLFSMGKRFMHHNHAREFLHEGGKCILDRLAEDFAPDKLGFILDTYWVQRGGCDPAEYLTKLKGRVPCIHLKDYVYLASNESAFGVVGEGNLNFERIFAAAESAGTEYMLVEQDDCYGEDPFDCLQRSYAYLRACGF